MKKFTTLLVALMVYLFPADTPAQSSVLQCGAPTKNGNVEFLVQVYDKDHKKVVEEKITVREIKDGMTDNQKAEKISNTVQAHLDGNATFDAAVDVGHIGNVVALTTDNPEVSKIKVSKVKDGTGQKLGADAVSTAPVANFGQLQRKPEWEIGILFTIEGTPQIGGTVAFEVEGIGGEAQVVAGDTLFSILVRIRDEVRQMGGKSIIVYPMNSLFILDTNRDGEVNSVGTNAENSNLDVMWDRVYQ